MFRTLVLLLALFSSATATLAGEADVLKARATRDTDGTWRFDVTIRHADSGWDHYADRYEILDPATGRELAGASCCIRM